jgi:hypothetical protein
MNHDYEDRDNLLDQLNKESLPDGWEGGTVRHTGGGIWCREFHHPERELRVIYSMHQPRVGLEAVSKTDEGQWIFDEHLDDVDSPQHRHREIQDRTPVHGESQQRRLRELIHPRNRVRPI